jgi:thiamine monophosphate synthase
VIEAGADGVAVISAISMAESPQLTTDRLLQEILNGL